MWRKRRKGGLPAELQFDTLISEKTQIEGRLEFSGGVHLDGKVIGNVSALPTDTASTLVRVSRQGEVRGNIYAPNVIINGRVYGDVYASNYVELAENACINGNVYYRFIEMAVGAEVNGSLVHQEEVVAEGGGDLKDRLIETESASFTEA
ncbi:MAG: cell shape determination protein CcmA [unclassified Hahellaceae]|nr:cell shape determination protein CcmA [Hahellaceae bacterium]|tara:strand:+ start:22534 stop:22983 length:450 start_codon:yes stop_codon:yes gene_type:complete